MATRTICAAIIVVVVIVLLVVWASNDPYCGFWKADPRFLADSKLTTMLFYFGPGMMDRECVLYAANASGIILNRSTRVSISGFGKKKRVVLQDVDYPWFPSEQIMWLDTRKRCMVWTTNDDIPKITAKLYYDNCLSDVAPPSDEPSVVSDSDSDDDE